MSQGETPGMEAVTLAGCVALVGTPFTRPNPDGPDITLVLTEASRLKRDPRASAEGDRPFHLIFRGPPDPRLTQGMHTLISPHLDLSGIFLVPLDQDEEGFIYEAVFT